MFDEYVVCYETTVITCRGFSEGIPKQYRFQQSVLVICCTIIKLFIIFIIFIIIMIIIIISIIIIMINRYLVI